VLRRSEVVAVQVLEISPLENALHDVEQKTKELGQLNLKFTKLARTSQEISPNALELALSTVVDPPSTSGIIAYRQVYINPDYIDRYPERADMVEKLREAIDDHVSLIAIYIVT
jgi:dedicator of cytokinesis protein 3